MIFFIFKEYRDIIKNRA